MSGVRRVAGEILEIAVPLSVFSLDAAGLKSIPRVQSSAYSLSVTTPVWDNCEWLTME